MVAGPGEPFDPYDDDSCGERAGMMGTAPRA